MAEFQEALRQPIDSDKDRESFIGAYTTAYMRFHDGETLPADADMATTQAYMDAMSMSFRAADIPVYASAPTPVPSAKRPELKTRASTRTILVLAAAGLCAALTTFGGNTATERGDTSGANGGNLNPDVPAEMLILRDETNRVCDEFESGVRQNSPQPDVTYEPPLADAPESWSEYSIAGNHDVVIIGDKNFMVDVEPGANIGRLIVCSTDDVAVHADDNVANIGMRGKGAFVTVETASNVYANGLGSTVSIDRDGSVSTVFLEGSNQTADVWGILNLGITEAGEISNQFKTDMGKGTPDAEVGTINHKTTFTS